MMEAQVGGFNIDQIRADFPVLNRKIHGKNLVYLDSAATSLKPKPVIDALADHYLNRSANVHRGVHTLSEEATIAFEGVREKVAKFLGARETAEIIFTRGTTDSINLVAQSFGKRLSKEDSILITGMEHHSNIVPWQMLREDRGVQLKILPITDDGSLDMDSLPDLLDETVKLVSIVQVSNSLGTINPVKQIIELAHKKNIPVLVDAAQAVGHLPVNVQDLDADFLAFSAHKIFGPTGTGVLYGKREWLEQLDPVQGGGDMIASVTFEKTSYNTLPYKFEAGTPHIAGVIGLGAALDYVQSIGVQTIHHHEGELLAEATHALKGIPGVRLIGEASQKTAILSFILEGIHPHDIGTIVDQEGVAIRTGHHCTQPVMQFFGVPATARAAFGVMNNLADIEQLVSAIHKVKEIFQ